MFKGLLEVVKTVERNKSITDEGFKIICEGLECLESIENLSLYFSK